MYFVTSHVRKLKVRQLLQAAGGGVSPAEICAEPEELKGKFVAEQSHGKTPELKEKYGWKSRIYSFFAWK